MVFGFVQKFFFGQHESSIFFSSEFNIRLYDKNSESNYFFFLHQNQNIFFSNIGWESEPPFKLNGHSLRCPVQLSTTITE